MLFITLGTSSTQIQFELQLQDYLLQLGPDFCVVMINDIPNMQQWVIGTIFIHNYYTVFDYAIKSDPRVGFNMSKQTR